MASYPQNLRKHKCLLNWVQQLFIASTLWEHRQSFEYCLKVKELLAIENLLVFRVTKTQIILYKIRNGIKYQKHEVEIDHYANLEPHITNIMNKTAKDIICRACLPKECLKFSTTIFKCQKFSVTWLTITV